MLAPDDLADLVEVLRGSGYKPSPQQAIGAQQLVLQLAAAGALPATRHALGGLLAPIFCTSAAEQERFGDLFHAWLARRFPEGTAVPAPSAPARATSPRVSAGQRAALVILSLLVAGVALWVALRGWPPGLVTPGAAPEVPVQRPLVSTAPETAPAEPAPAEPAPAGAPVKIASFELAPLLPPPTWAERISWPGVAVSALPLLLFGAWQWLRRRRRPVLQRTASRTPARLREVQLPGGVRLLLPQLPLRRLAQDMRRRRDVPSDELQVEPTIAATLRAGGLFTPVRGSRVEPEYLALVDRAALADHQALLGAELIAELARADVLVERFDFDHDATVCRPRDALRGARLHAGHAGHAANGGAGAGRSAAVRTAWKARELHSVELTNLHERHPDHRVLVFGDGAGCFDAFTGMQAPWLLTLLQWPTPVLLTPRPVERWSRREWALQRLGVQVLPVSRAGLLALGALYAAGRGDAAGVGAPGRPELPMHERTPRRWLERDPPPAEVVERLCTDLRLDLGPHGFAWLAACAAYPEVHWGITLRLGPALVNDAAELERLLPRLARLVWLRDAYMPDWLRQTLIERLDGADEAHARDALRTMLEALAERREGDIPLRIALGEPRTEWPWWRRAWAALRERGLRARTADLLRTAAPDSPLRDHVFLRFLSGQHARRIDLAAPGALLRLLRATPRAVPTLVGVAAVVFSALLTLRLAPIGTGEPMLWADTVHVDQEALSAGVIVHRKFAGGMQYEGSAEPTVWDALSPTLPPVLVGLAQTRTGPDRGTWRTIEPYPLTNATRHDIAPAPWRQIVERDGSLVVEHFDMPVIELAVLEQSSKARQARFSADGRRVVASLESALGVWDAQSGRRVRELAMTDSRVLDWSIGHTGKLLAVLTAPGTVSVWDVDSGAVQVLGEGLGVVPPVRLRISPDERSVALLDRSGPIDIWDVSSGQRWDLNLRAPAPTFSTETRMDWMPISADFSRAALIDARWVRLWNLRSGDVSEPLPGLFGASGLDVKLNATGSAMLVRERSNGLRLWSTVDPRPLGESMVSAEALPENVWPDEQLAVSADGRTLALAAEGTLAIWSLPLAGDGAPTPEPSILPPAASPGPESVVDARARLIAKYPALRDKTLALVGLRVRHGWIVDAVTPVFGEVLPDGTLGGETWEGERVGGGGGGETLVQRPGQVISEIVVQRGRYEGAQVVALIDARFRPLGGTSGKAAVGAAELARQSAPNVGPDARQEAANRAVQEAAAEATRGASGLPQSGTSTNTPVPGLRPDAAQANVSSAPQRAGLARGTQINEPPQRYVAGVGEVFSDLRLAAALNNNGTPYLGVLEASAGTLRLRAGLSPASPAAAASTALDLRAAATANKSPPPTSLSSLCQAAIAGRYPFSRTSEKDTTLADFGEMFGVGGRLDAYFRDRLADAVDTSTPLWRFRQPGAPQPVSAQALAQFQRAATIREAFFPTSSKLPSITLAVRPIALSPAIKQLTLEVDGQFVNYAHGPVVSTPLQWPGPGRNPRARLSFQPPSQQGEPELATDGPWALLRLFERAAVTAGKAPESVRTVFEIDRHTVVFDITSASLRNPLLLLELREFRCPNVP